MSDPDTKEPASHIQSRFSTFQLRKICDNLAPDQRNWVIKYKLQNLLQISPFHVPYSMLEWIMDNMHSLVAEFRLNEKRIKFTKQIVTQVVGIPSGKKPVQMGSKDPMVVKLVDDLRSKYLVGNKAKTNHVISLLEKDHDEVSFMQTFMLLVIQSVLNPQTSHTVNLRYLYSLLDVNDIPKIDWSDHILDSILLELNRFHQEADNSNNGAQPIKYYGSCLPLLAMDHLDLSLSIPRKLEIKYDVPRFCHVTTDELEYVSSIDKARNKSGKCVYGALDFRDVSSTPYSKEALQVSIYELEHVDGDGASTSCAKDDSNEDIPVEVATLVQNIVQKNNETFLEELKQLHLKQVSNLVKEVTGALHNFYSKQSKGNGSGESGDKPQAHVQQPVQQHSETEIIQQGNEDQPNALSPQEHNNLNEFSHTEDIVDVDDNLTGDKPQAPVQQPVQQNSETEIIQQGNEDQPNALSPLEHNNLNEFSHTEDIVDVDGNLTGQRHSETEIVLKVNDDQHHSVLLQEAFTNQSIQHDAFVANLIIDHITKSINDQFSEEIGQLIPTTTDFKEQRSPTIATCSTFDSDLNQENHVATTPLNLDSDASYSQSISVAATEDVANQDGGNMSTGFNTKDDINCRKRGTKDVDENCQIYQLKVQNEAHVFYDDVMSSTFCNSLSMDRSNEFIRISGLYASYENFVDSLKPGGKICDEVMSLHTKVFSKPSKNDPATKCKKIAFISTLTSKLIRKPENFDIQSCRQEIQDMHSLYNMKRDDLLFFPLPVDDQWVLICINTIDKHVNFFDSLHIISNDRRDEWIANMKVNLYRVCFEAETLSQDIREFELDTSLTYPSQNNVIDSGVYVMLYMENFDGKLIKYFDVEVVPKFRKVVAFHLIMNSRNPNGPEYFKTKVYSKKRKRQMQ